MPNWEIHNKWALKAGIDDLVATFVNQNIDYGTSWAFNKETEATESEEKVVDRQLRFFYHKDKEKTFSSEFLYVRAFYLHHLLDYFKETRYNKYDLELIFTKFIQEKVKPTLINDERNEISFLNEINYIFGIIRHYKEEFFSDLQR
jgi:hypothetical protein